MRDFDKYADLWRAEERAMKTPTGFRHVEMDLNVAPPMSWHFGPPPDGWGSYVAPPPAKYLGQPLTLLSGLAAPQSNLNTTTPAGVLVLWVQRRLRGAGFAITTDGLYGPQTASALRSFVLRFAPDPARPAGWDFDPLSGGSTAPATMMYVGDLLFRALGDVTPQSSPSGSTGGGGTVPPPEPPPATPQRSSAMPLLALVLGGGLAYYYSQRNG